MDTDKIEILIKAIEMGSMSKAANVFSYTPSAVSHIADVIENEVGIKFIRRTYSGIEIEPGCEMIVDNFRKIVSLQKQTKQIASDILRNKKGVTIGTYASLSKHIMAKIIKGFNKQFPDININIIVMDDINKVFEDNEADILLAERIEGENIGWQEILTDPYVAVFPDNTGNQNKSISIEELYKYTFIKTRENKIAQYIDESKFDNVINVDSHDDSSVIYMVKEGLGIAVLPMLSVRDEKNVQYKTLEPGFDRKLGVIYRKTDFEKTTELRKFIEYIRLFDFNQFSL